MRLLRKEATAYALLMVLLFGIAAVAVRETLQYLERLGLDERPHSVLIVLICSITFGLMLIAGAFGLWATRFAAQNEGRRRVGRFVDTMEYLRDGLLAVDRKGRITGANPMARRIIGTDIARHPLLSAAFPSLPAQEVSAILNSSVPQEVVITHGKEVMLRIRSQPSEGMVHVLLSDITDLEVRRRHSRVTARLQLIGEIARGVAYDFNNLMCAISGYNSLLTRFPPQSSSWIQARDAITRNVERGTALAGRLLEISSGTPTPASAEVGVEYVESAVDTLRNLIPAEWKVESAPSPLPAVSLAGIKVEQIIVNLGVLCTDQASRPGTLTVLTAPARGGPAIADTDERFAGVIVVGACPLSAMHPGNLSPRAARDPGVILSVIRTMVEESEGVLEVFTAEDDAPVYRVRLTREKSGSRDTASLEGSDLSPYVNGWNVIVSASGRQAGAIESRLQSAGVQATRSGAMASLLTQVESTPKIDGIVVDRAHLLPDPPAILKVIMKLSPQAGIVVLGDFPAHESAALSGRVVFAESEHPAEKILLSLIEARALSLRRRGS